MFMKSGKYFSMPLSKHTFKPTRFLFVPVRCESLTRSRSSFTFLSDIYGIVEVLVNSLLANNSLGFFLPLNFVSHVGVMGG